MADIIPLKPAQVIPIRAGREAELLARYEQLFASISAELSEIAEENERIIADNETRIAAIIKRQWERSNNRIRSLSMECASVALGRKNKNGGGK